MNAAGAEGPDEGFRPALRARVDPAFEERNADQDVGNFAHALAIEHLRKILVAIFQYGLAESRGADWQGQRLLQMRVVFQGQARPQLFQKVENLVERERIQIRQRRRSAERQAIDVLAHIGCAESGFRIAAAVLDVGILDHFTADDERYLVHCHGVTLRIGE